MSLQVEVLDRQRRHMLWCIRMYMSTPFVYMMHVYTGGGVGKAAAAHACMHEYLHTCIRYMIHVYTGGGGGKTATAG